MQQRRQPRRRGVRPEMAYMPCPDVLPGKQRVIVAVNELTCLRCGETFWDNERCPQCLVSTPTVPTLSYLTADDILPVAMYS